MKRELCDMKSLKVMVHLDPASIQTDITTHMRPE